MSNSYKAITIRSNKGKLPSIECDVMIMCNSKGLKAHAIWDTGASGTCISERVVKQLGITPIGFTVVSTANNTRQSGQFIVDLAFPNNLMAKDLRVTEFSGTDDVDVLIGMDVICAGDMAITNASGITVFSYRVPSDWIHIDYVKSLRPDKQGKTIKSQIKKFQHE